MEYKTLSNGVKIPIIGFGVFLIKEDGVCERCVSDALEIGYRHIDTAQAYENEHQVGAAISKSNIPRDEIFITTKVRFAYYGGYAYESVMRSLDALGVDYIDLCLLHQPYGDVHRAWRDLERLYSEGLLRSIGVSNFYPDRLADLSVYSDVSPMVNQIECHPLFARRQDIKWCEEFGALPEAWSPFGRGRGGLFENAVLTEIGEKYGKTAAQVMLRWNIQRGIIVLPKSEKRDRIASNFDVFDFTLTEDDMQRIFALDTNESLFYRHYDPQIIKNHSSGVKAALDEFLSKPFISK